MDAENFPDLGAALVGGDVDARQTHHTASFRPLFHFIMFNIKYLPVEYHPLDRECPICRETTSESHERMLQVDLPSCKHSFGADCFERYIQRPHTCPMCREMWFNRRLTPEIPSSQGLIRNIVIEVTVADDEAAEAFLESMRHNSGEIMERMLGERIVELGADERIPFEASVVGHGSDSGGESGDSSPESDRTQATCLEITFGESAEAGFESAEIGSESSAEGYSTVLARRARRDGSRSASDTETVARPRRRRRHE